MPAGGQGRLTANKPAKRHETPTDTAHGPTTSPRSVATPRGCSTGRVASAINTQSSREVTLASKQAWPNDEHTARRSITPSRTPNKAHTRDPRIPPPGFPAASKQRVPLGGYLNTSPINIDPPAPALQPAGLSHALITPGRRLPSPPPTCSPVTSSPPHHEPSRYLPRSRRALAGWYAGTSWPAVWTVTKDRFTPSKRVWYPATWRAARVSSPQRRGSKGGRIGVVWGRKKGRNRGSIRGGAEHGVGLLFGRAVVVPASCCSYESWSASNIVRV